MPTERNNAYTTPSTAASVGVASPTTIVPKTDIKVHEANNPLRLISKSSTVADVAAALAALGAKPRDLVSILLTLRKAGALRAEVVVQ